MPVALVTGGAKRVGRAIVEKLADSGYDIAFTYLSSQSEAAGLTKALRRRRVLAIRADLTNPDEAVANIDVEFRKKFRRLDVLVNSASLYLPARLDRTTTPMMQKLLAIHFQSPLLLAKALAPMLRRSRGHIVNMTDLLAERPWPEFLAYCASKAALSSLTLGLARELAPEVTVNAIAPGVVEWPPDYPEAEQRKYLKRVPLNRSGTAEEVANLVHFLVTDGSYITGQILRLDGGRSIT